MKRLARKLPGGLMFGALVFGSLVNGVATAEEVVGAVNTQLRVTEQGAASFSIPINLPQARGGVRPELALAYDSSQLAAGEAGIGWSLSGSQSIRRCPPTPYHDGRIDAVNYSSGDRFCLNGQRLRLVSGNYGASGSRYAAVNQPGWRISAHGGNSANGPRYFKIETQARDTLYFGDTSSVLSSTRGNGAFVEPGGVNNGDKARAWLLSSVEDGVGNHIDYVYGGNRSLGSQQVTAIHYGGYRPEALPHYISVNFDYQRIEQPVKGFYAGHPIGRDKRLTGIRVSIDDQASAQWSLTYDTSTADSHGERLTAVTECAYAANGRVDCKRPVRFDWQTDGLDGRLTYADALNGLPEPGKVKTLDYNGDGFTDLAFVSDGRWRVSYGPDFDDAVSVGRVGVDEAVYALTIDANNDGEMALLVPGSQNWMLLSRKGTRNLYIPRTGYDGKTWVLDVNGDAYPDIVFIDERQIKAYLNDGDGSFSQAVVLYSFNGAGTNRFGDNTETPDVLRASLVDFNGDGRSDMMVPVRTYHTQCVKSNGDTLPGASEHDCKEWGGTFSSWDTEALQLFTMTGELASPVAESIFYTSALATSVIRAGDINGDGLTDIILHADDQWHYRLSNGRQFEPGVDLSLSSKQSAEDTWFVDLNQDGRVDVLLPTSDNAWSVFLNRRDANGGVTFESNGVITRSANSPPLIGLFNDDAGLDVMSYYQDRWRLYANHQSQPQNRIKRFTSSTGVVTDIEYAPMSDDDVYLGANAKADDSGTLISPRSQQALVSRVTTDVTAESRGSVRYQYEGLLLNTDGLGSLGFAALTTTDEQTGVTTITRYYQSEDAVESVLNGFPLVTEQWLQGQRLSYAENTLATQADVLGGYFGYIQKTREDHYTVSDSLSSAMTGRTRTSTYYDNDGNVTRVQAQQRDMAAGVIRTTDTRNSYSDTRYGRLSRTQVDFSQSDRSDSYQRVSTFSYQSNGLLSETVLAPDDDDYRLTTAYRYDRFGQKIAVSKTGNAGPGLGTQTRTSKTQYGSNGRYVALTENALGLQTQYRYNHELADDARGVVYKLQTINSNNERAQEWFDAFGRTVKSEGADGVQSTITRLFCNNCRNGALTQINQVKRGAPTAVSYQDRWGREVAQLKTHFDGYWRLSTTDYDTQGRVSVQQAANKATTTYRYDVLGRVIETVDAQAASTTVSYGLDDIETTNALGQTSTEYRNGLGEVTATRDELGNRVEFTYDAMGRLINSEVAGGSANGSPQVIRYDVWGNKVAMDDPVKGQWRYRYNAFGELVAQTTAHDETQTFSYDVGGRLVRSYSPRSATVCREYGDSASANNRGRLVAVNTYNDLNLSCNTTRGKSHQVRYEYDSAGRQSARHTQMYGQRYSEYYRFDDAGRLASTRYPDAGETTVTVGYRYNSGGYLYELRRVETDTVLKTIESANDLGQVTHIAYVNGHTASRSYNDLGWLRQTSAKLGGSDGVLNSVEMGYDRLGNVTSRLSYFGRINGATEVTETYQYDAINRLLSSSGTIKQGSDVARFDSAQTYDRFGNITRRAGVGEYVYSDDRARRLLAIRASQAATQAESSSPARASGASPDAGPCFLCTNTLAANASQLSTTGYAGREFSYDASGNVLSDGVREFTYNGNDKLTRVVANSNRSTMRYAGEALYYQLDQSTSANGQSVEYEKHIVGAFEKKVRAGGAGNRTEYRYTIADDLVIVEDGQGERNTYLLFKDHIGSVFTMANINGDVLSQQVFSAFGQARPIYSSAGLQTGAVMLPTEQGYTGHRQMTDFGLVHMKGRIYDPTLGRFLQADPHIQAPKNSQSHNRYAYVLNNPLSYTDPSGYFFKWLGKKIKKYWRPIVAIVAAYFAYTQGLEWLSSTATVSNTTTATTTTAFGTVATTSTVTSTFTYATTSAYIGAGALGGTIGGAITTGSLRGAFTGAVAGVFGGWANSYSLTTVGGSTASIAISATGGCLAGKASGGSCSQGAKLAAMAQALKVGLDNLAGAHSSLKTSNGEAVVKPGGALKRAMLAEGENVDWLDSTIDNTGEAVTVSDRDYKFLIGKPVSEAIEILQSMGQNPSIVLKNLGMTGESGKFMSFLSQNIGGVRSSSVVHDRLVGLVERGLGMEETWYGTAFTVGSIAPAFYAQYTAFGAHVYDYYYRNLKR